MTSAALQNVHCSRCGRFSLGSSLLLLQFLGMQSYPLIAACGRWLLRCNNIHHNEGLFIQTGPVTNVKRITTSWSDFLVRGQMLRMQVWTKKVLAFNLEINQQIQFFLFLHRLSSILISTFLLLIEEYALKAPSGAPLFSRTHV